MHKSRLLAIFTLREIIAQPIYRTLCVLAFVFILTSFILSQSFLFETGKVLVDLIWLSMGVISLIYVLFIGCTMLAQDIGNQMVYFFIPLLRRDEYLKGRLAGIFLALILLFFWIFLLATLAITWSISSTVEVYRHGLSIWTALPLASISLLQALAALALVAFACSWATSQAEMLVFSTAFIVFSAIFPAIIETLQSPEVLANTPSSIVILIQGISFLFPKVNASSFAIAQAHGLSIPLSDWLALIVSYMGYTLLSLTTAFFIFSKRDL